MPESEGSNLDCNTGESGTISPYGYSRASDYRSIRNKAARSYTSSPVDTSTDPTTHTDKGARNVAIDANNIANAIDSHKSRHYH